MSTTALLSLPVGVLVERRKAASAWLDYLWIPAAVLAGEPETRPWTVVAQDGGVTTFYAGSAVIELFRSATGNYRDNLVQETPQLWVVLRPTGVEPPYTLLAVTADPSEGEAFTETGTDLVETVAMPPAIRDALEDFVVAHHVEQPFFKRRRDRAEPDALGRRPRGERGGRE